MYSATDTPKKPGATSKTPNQPEVKFIQTAVMTSTNVLKLNNFTKLSLTNQNYTVNLL